MISCNGIWNYGKLKKIILMYVFIVFLSIFPNMLIGKIKIRPNLHIWILILTIKSQVPNLSNVSNYKLFVYHFGHVNIFNQNLNRKHCISTDKIS